MPRSPAGRVGPASAPVAFELRVPHDQRPTTDPRRHPAPGAPTGGSGNQVGSYEKSRATALKAGVLRGVSTA